MLKERTEWPEKWKRKVHIFALPSRQELVYIKYLGVKCTGKSLSFAIHHLPVLIVPHWAHFTMHRDYDYDRLHWLVGTCKSDEKNQLLSFCCSILPIFCLSTIDNVYHTMTQSCLQIGMFVEKLTWLTLIAHFIFVIWHLSLFCRTWFSTQTSQSSIHLNHRSFP